MSNTAKYLQELSSHLSGFLVYDELIQELIPIVKASGNAKRFFSILYRRLDFLKTYGKNAQEHHEEFERLNADIYSLHIKSQFFNVRILYSFLEDGTILLRAFEEKSNKRVTDYTNQIPLAQERLQAIKEDHHE